MSAPARDLLATRRGAAVVAALIAVLFLLLRIALLFAREPFYDELFTLWLARHSFGAILDALKLDSGPPLYYFALHALRVFASVAAMRGFSLLCALAALAIILRARLLGAARFLAAALLAVHPPSVLFAVDARAYAMCALFVTIGVVALAAWSDAQPNRWAPFVAMSAFVLAAYSHFYGVLFFPLPAVAAILPVTNRRRALAGILATLGAFVLFVPGLLLARQQPLAATAWFGEHPPPAGAPFLHLGLAAAYPDSLFAPAPTLLIAAALLLFAISIVRTLSSRVATRFAVMTLVPLAGALAIQFAGRRVWFPMRFESIIAIPLLLWLATALDVWKRPLRIALATATIAIGLAASWTGVIDHFRRPIDPYRAAAIYARRAVDPQMPIVASGYLWLETESERDARRQEPIVAFPAEQASHPGWRAQSTPATLVRERATLPPSFVWIGEAGTPEMAAICRDSKTRMLFDGGRAVVLAVARN